MRLSKRIALLCCMLVSRVWGGDWPRLLGPLGDGVAVQEKAIPENAERTMKELWRLTLGESYTSPSILGDKMVLFHRLNDEEVVDCHDLRTRERLWRFTYPTRYIDQYGYNNGPRSTPIFTEKTVYTLGAEGKMHALDVEDGSKKWDRWLNLEYKVEQDFFGVGGSPILVGDRLILNLGGSKTGAGVICLSAADGKTLWKSTDHGPSYATPVFAEMHRRPTVFVFSKMGLTSLEPETGKVNWDIPFRSRLYESVNASTPIVSGDLLLASATYGTGSICLRIKPDGEYEEVWRSVASMDSHFSNLMERDGYVYGFAGRHSGDAELRCLEMSTGKVAWSKPTLLARGSMIRVGDQTILWGEYGHLSVRMLTEKGPPDLPEDPASLPPLLKYPCWTPPVLSKGILYLRNEKTLVAYDLSPQP